MMIQYVQEVELLPVHIESDVLKTYYAHKYYHTAKFKNALAGVKRIILYQLYKIQ